MTLTRSILGSRGIALSLGLGLLGSACATAVPAQLTQARTAYARASAGPAAAVVPADLHKAEIALGDAEKSFAQDEDSGKIIDLAYIAERTAQIAEAHAQTALAEKRTSTAKQELANKQSEMAKQTLGALAATRQQLTEAERAKSEEANRATAERTAREAADQKAVASEQKAAASDEKAAAADLKTQQANDALAKLAAKEEERGMVITLSGSVLFRSNDATLLPAAESRLNQVADALVAKGRNVVVEGYTDSRGSQATNMALSQGRAESVRSYLMSRGFPGDKIEAHGMGPAKPVADNTSAEGRANNRRVEIIIPRNAAPSVTGPTSQQ